MPRFLTSAAALALLLVAGIARAQNDAPIPYPDDDDQTERKVQRRSERNEVRDETQVEKEDRDRNLGRFDDPNVGVAFELVSGAMLVEASQGTGVSPGFDWGLRFTWEFGRLFPDEFFHEALFADLTWTYTTLHDGTQQINADANYHYFSVAPAFFIPFGYKAWFGAYAQLGGGFAYQADAVHVNTNQTTISGIKPLFQYGVGLRGRPPLNSDGTLRLCFRLELTRFRRGYMDDTFIGGSVGADF